MQNKISGLATIAGVFALLLWSSSVGVSRSLIEKIGTFTAASLILFLGGLLSCIIVAVTDFPSFCAMFRLPWKLFAGRGVLFVSYMVCLYVAVGTAVNHIVLLGVNLLNYLWPTFIILFSIFLLRYRVKWFIILGIIMAMCGTVLAVTGPTLFTWTEVAENVRANWLTFLPAFGAGVFWGLYSVTGKKFDSGSVNVTPLYLIISGIILGCIRLGVFEISNWNIRAAGELCFIVIFPVTLAYNLWETGIKKGDFILISVFSYFVPVISTFIICFYLGVVPGIRIWLGSTLLGLGALLCKKSLSE